MFKFLKDKLKDAVSKFSTKVDEEAETEEVTQEVEETVEDKIEEKVEESKKEEDKNEPEEEAQETKEEEPQKESTEEIKEKETSEEKKEEEKEKPIQEEDSSKETEEESVKEEQESKEIQEEEKEKPTLEVPSEVDIQEEKSIEIKEEEPSPQKETPHADHIEKELEENITLTEEPEVKKEEIHPESQAAHEALDEVKAEDSPAEPEKKGFFSRIKNAFSKEEKEEGSEVKPVEVQVTSAVKEDIEELEKDTETQESLEEEIESKKEEFTQEAKEVDKEAEETIQEEVIVEKPAEKESQTKEEPAPEKKGFFSKITQTITTKKIDEEKFNDLFWELEMAMLENSVAVEVIEKIKEDLKSELVNKPISRKEIESTIVKTLQRSIEELFELDTIDVIHNVKKKNEEGKPYVICFVGINGSGKTTSIAKVAHMLKKQGLEPVLAASDTFRAAAIDQLQHHADKIDVKIIRHDYNSDPAAVAFDAVKHAEAAKKQVVLIDTAGRLHSNTNLMEELHKIVKVAKPDLTLFVGESITGNDCIEQAQAFNKMTDIDGIILSKADIDEKGGAAISISYILKKPIVYFGVGQEYDDLRPFSLEFIQKNLAF